MKIVVLDGYTLSDIGWDMLKNFGDIKVYDRTQKEDIIRRIGYSDIVFTNKCPITKSIMQKCPNIKYIGILATGYNIVDIKEAKERGIVVCNVPTYGTDIVAQTTMALLLEICHHIGEHNRSVKEGKWAKNPDFSYWDYPILELTNKTMGIIGFGKIGQAIAKRAVPFGINVLAYDKYESDEAKEIAKYVSLDELLEKSDIISTATLLTEETKGIINNNTINKMKDGVIIINNARGPLIEEEDLKQALNSGKVSYAAVDVVSVEPILASNPLLSAKNIIITPHISWASKDARTRIIKTCADNLQAFLNNNPINVVN